MTNYLQRVAAAGAARAPEARPPRAKAPQLTSGLPPIAGDMLPAAGLFDVTLDLLAEAPAPEAARPTDAPAHQAAPTAHLEPPSDTSPQLCQRPTPRRLPLRRGRRLRRSIVPHACRRPHPCRCKRPRRRQLPPLSSRAGRSRQRVPCQSSARPMGCVCRQRQHLSCRRLIPDHAGDGRPTLRRASRRYRRMPPSQRCLPHPLPRRSPRFSARPVCYQGPALLLTRPRPSLRDQRCRHAPDRPRRRLYLRLCGSRCRPAHQRRLSQRHRPSSVKSP
jgi:hypothetical protein